jgi:hypothetical protein
MTNANCLSIQLTFSCRELFAPLQIVEMEPPHQKRCKSIGKNAVKRILCATSILDARVLRRRTPMKTLSKFDITYCGILADTNRNFLSGLVIDRCPLFLLLFGGIPKCLFKSFCLRPSGGGHFGRTALWGDDPDGVAARAGLANMAGPAGIVLGPGCIPPMLPYNYVGGLGN